MLVDPKLLRKFFAVGAVGAGLVAAGFYLRSIMHWQGKPGQVPQVIAPNLQQDAKHFTWTRSDGQKKLLTIRAETVQQFKEGDRYELHDASIILYGRDGSRSDQIYGSDFQYDKSSGEVVAKGEVEIDLAANSPVAGASGPVAQVTKSVVHLKTSGLTFNENTGLAQTSERIEFRIPDASGSALGATYDSRANLLTLKSAVKVVTTGKQKANISGESAAILRSPDRIIMQKARIEQTSRVVETDKLTVMLRTDNTVEKILGSGSVRAQREGPKGYEMTAPEGELSLDANSQPRTGALSGGVSMVGRGETPSQGKAGRLLLAFGGKGKLDKVRAEDSVDFQQGPAGKSQEIQAAAVDLYLHDGKTLDKAVTSSGPARIVLAQGTTKSEISAGQFDGRFGQENRLKSIFGSPNASIVSTSPGQIDRMSSSREVLATFNAKGEMVSAEQNGDFHYEQGDRKGWADHARYNPGDESFLLTGSPRLVQADSSVTADSIQINRKNDTAYGQGNVKSTYNQKPQANSGAATAGAMLASGGDPIHVTGSSVTASRSSGTARYTAARLWRGADIVEAPTIVFDQPHRSLQAQGNKSARVASVFVQPEKSGKTTPVHVTADKLTYVDSERKAVYSGNVLVQIEGGTITADTAEAWLTPRGWLAGTQSGSQLDRIVAQGDIKIEQTSRKATGAQLMYSAGEEKFVLTGSPGRPPSIFDAEQGQISGDSLTFFTHDGRVLVGSGKSSQSSIPTKVHDASTK
jgi:lipopolysaccharide export system protein LptA